MERRLDYAKAAPAGLNALRNLQAYVNNCGLEHSLLELVWIFTKIGTMTALALVLALAVARAR